MNEWPLYCCAYIDLSMTLIFSPEMAARCNAIWNGVCIQKGLFDLNETPGQAWLEDAQAWSNPRFSMVHKPAKFRQRAFHTSSQTNRIIQWHGVIHVEQLIQQIWTFMRSSAGGTHSCCINKHTHKHARTHTHTHTHTHTTSHSHSHTRFFPILDPS